jgi:hypothetical protein
VNPTRLRSIRAIIPNSNRVLHVHFRFNKRKGIDATYFTFFIVEHKEEYQAKKLSFYNSLYIIIPGSNYEPDPQFQSPTIYTSPSELANIKIPFIPSNSLEKCLANNINEEFNDFSGNYDSSIMNYTPKETLFSWNPLLHMYCYNSIFATDNNIPDEYVLKEVNDDVNLKEATLNSFNCSTPMNYLCSDQNLYSFDFIPEFPDNIDPDIFRLQNNM